MEETQVTQGDTPSRNTRNRAWCFTWNNYTVENIQYLQEVLADGEYLFGEEKGDTNNTPHLQGVVRFKNARTFDSIRKLLKNNHIEGCRNWAASLNYCSKDGQTYTNIKGKEKKETLGEKILRTRYGNVEWKDWQQQVISHVESEPDDRKIMWITDEAGGSGKSFLYKYLVLKYGAILCGGKAADVFNQIKTWMEDRKNEESPRLVLMDIPRHNIEYINYGCLEQIKDGCIYSGKYEGGQCIFESPHVIVFSNQAPDFSKFTRDRWIHIVLEEVRSCEQALGK